MLEFPVTLKSITKFENANDVSVNVYGVEESGKCFFVPVFLRNNTILKERF